ncbi:SRPBCC family protein [Modestobacter sp. I12A-02628]|uniref:SRPBCC family protein n=1 Tax=Goekera deserti TaxID=2497753 RepID=A0A7K3WJI2_9ACTN|nr:SRPBCC family protein [Goekera deserti]MPQ98956.1 SRPBCC family protein [Goekera deserti]NDI49544.1 SRPBCC family protein [Goekera deserti]NEL56651.1 SRPBCC family protein [Goekera deserti]
MESLTHRASVVVHASPEAVYDLVSDVTRTGEWSPICRECRWEDGAGGAVGDWFTGHNETPERSWDTRSQVVVADRGREFAWVVGGTLVRWGFLMEPADGGTLLTETWEFLTRGQEFFVERYGDQAPQQVAERTRAAHEGIPATLDAVKRIAEA